MTQFELDMMYCDDAVNALKAVINNLIYDNTDYRQVTLGNTIKVFYKRDMVMGLHKEVAFGTTMTVNRTMQINSHNYSCMLLEFKDSTGNDVYNIIPSSAYVEEQYFQDSLIVDPKFQRELLLVTKIVEYIKTTKFSSIEIYRDYLPILIADVKALWGESNDI